MTCTASTTAIPLAVVTLLAVALSVGLLSFRRHFSAVWDRYDVYETRRGNGDDSGGDGDDEGYGDSGTGEDGGGGSYLLGTLQTSPRCLHKASETAVATQGALAALPCSGGDGDGGGVAGIVRSTNGVIGGDLKRIALVFDDVSVKVPHCQSSQASLHQPRDDAYIGRTNTTNAEEEVGSGGGGDGGSLGGGGFYCGRGHATKGRPSWRRWMWTSSGEAPKLPLQSPSSRSPTAQRIPSVGSTRRQWRQILSGVSGALLG